MCSNVFDRRELPHYSSFSIGLPNVMQYSDRDPLTGASKRSQHEKVAIFDHISLYLGNDTRYEILIGTYTHHTLGVTSNDVE